jgi:hypothetical protein
MTIVNSSKLIYARVTSVNWPGRSPNRLLCPRLDVVDVVVVEYRDGGCHVGTGEVAERTPTRLTNFQRRLNIGHVNDIQLTAIKFQTKLTSYEQAIRYEKLIAS